MTKCVAASTPGSLCRGTKRCQGDVANKLVSTTKQRKLIHEVDENPACFVDKRKQPMCRAVAIAPQLRGSSTNEMCDHFLQGLPCCWKEVFPHGCLVVIPHFFKDKLPRATIQQSAQPSTSLTTPRRSSMGCKFLTAAVERARREIGAVDTIPPHASLVVAITFQNSGQVGRGWDQRGTVAMSKQGNLKPLRGRRRGHCAVIGLCITTEQDQAFHLQRNYQDLFAHAMPNSAYSSDASFIGDACVSGTLFCGINLIWVAPDFRECGVAFAMVEVARKHASYGNVIPREHVAFLEPTALGAVFAQRYSVREDFLIFPITEYH